MAVVSQVFKATFHIKQLDLSFTGYFNMKYARDWRELRRLISAIYSLFPRKFQGIVYSLEEGQWELLIPLPEELFACIGREARTHFAKKGKIFYIPHIPAMAIALDDLVSRDPIAIIGDVHEKDIPLLDKLKDESLGLLLVEILP